ncbi:MAG: CZB domain-containing protein [Pseudobdellovibrio sp.]
MDFDSAIKAHTAWKMKLGNYIKKPDGSIKTADVQFDNKCDLGQWIYGEGSKHSAMAEFSALKAEHAKFHKCAAAIIAQADAGKSVTEDIALGANSEFATASSNVIGLIMKMRRNV